MLLLLLLVAVFLSSIQHFDSVGSQKGKPVSFVLNGSLLEQAEDGHRGDQVYLEHGR